MDLSNYPAFSIILSLTSSRSKALSYLIPTPLSSTAKVLLSLFILTTSSLLENYGRISIWSRNLLALTSIYLTSVHTTSTWV